MKKLLIVLIIMILLSCGTKQTSKSLQKEQSKAIRNSKCEDIQDMKVFQILNKFVLAYICDNSYLKNRALSRLSCNGPVVYIQKEQGKIYYDDQIISVKDDECVIFTGTYKYKANFGLMKTVPKVKIIKLQVPNSE